MKISKLAGLIKSLDLKKEDYELALNYLEKKESLEAGLTGMFADGSFPIAYPAARQLAAKTVKYLLNKKILNIPGA